MCIGRRRFIRFLLATGSGLLMPASACESPRPGSAPAQPAYWGLEETGKPAERIEEAYGQLSRCRLCPRECGADRQKGESGFVTPTHVMPSILKATRLACRKGLRIPLVYNTSGCERLDMLSLLDGVVDIYMHQYHVDYKALEYLDIWHGSSSSEYLEAMAWAEAAGLTRLDPAPSRCGASSKTASAQTRPSNPMAPPHRVPPARLISVY